MGPSADGEPPGGPGLRTLRAPNPGPFTLDGTRTRLIGRERLVILDPGPDLPSHLHLLDEAIRGAASVTLALTHGHPDHAAAVDPLLELHPELRVVGAGHPRAHPLAEGARVESDAGALVALPTPGHTRDHLAFHWPERGSLFVGDLLLGEGETTWVAEYPGCVADWLESLDRVMALEPERLLPAHGPDLTDPAAAVERFRRHREERIAAVRRAVEEEPALADDPDRLLEVVYGATIPPGLEAAAGASLAELLHHVQEEDAR